MCVFKTIHLECILEYIDIFYGKNKYKYKYEFADPFLLSSHNAICCWQKKIMFEAKKEEGSSNNSECVCVFCPPSGQFWFRLVTISHRKNIRNQTNLRLCKTCLNGNKFSCICIVVIEHFNRAHQFVYVFFLLLYLWMLATYFHLLCFFSLSV